MEPQLKRIAMLLFDGCDLLDFAGPAGVFHSAARHLIRTGQTSEVRPVFIARRSARGSGAYLSMLKPARRFCCQHSSVDSLQNGFSLP